jgi:hypothetical protein
MILSGSAGPYNPIATSFTACSALTQPLKKKAVDDNRLILSWSGG